MVWERWSWPSLSLGMSEEERLRHLNERMLALERKLEEIDSVLDFGPIPGAYFPVELSYSNAAGITAAVVDLAGISFEARPIAAYLTVFGSGATVTVQINNSATPILAANQAVSTGTPVTLNDRGDFAVEKVYSPDLNLEVISVDAGTPIHLRAMVILKGVQKVEPT